MGSKRKRYDNEFRREAIRISSQPDVTCGQIEQELGLYQGAISRWKREMKEKKDSAFPGNGKLPAEQEELRALRRENERLRRERDILKKAAAYFSMDAIKDTRS